MKQAIQKTVVLTSLCPEDLYQDTTVWQRSIQLIGSQTKAPFNLPCHETISSTTQLHRWRKNSLSELWISQQHPVVWAGGLSSGPGAVLRHSQPKGGPPRPGRWARIPFNLPQRYHQPLKTGSELRAAAGPHKGGRSLLLFSSWTSFLLAAQRAQDKAWRGQLSAQAVLPRGGSDSLGDTLNWPFSNRVWGCVDCPACFLEAHVRREVLVHLCTDLLLWSIRESAWDKLLRLHTRKQMGWLAARKLINCHCNSSKDICIIYTSSCHRGAEFKHYVTWINNGGKNPNLTSREKIFSYRRLAINFLL